MKSLNGVVGMMSLWTGAIGRNSEGKWNITESDLHMWALSFGLAKQHFHKVILVTDDEGADILSFLPWDEIRLSLTRMPTGIERLWTMGKVVAYQNMEEPFISIDHDAFLFKNVKDFSDTFLAQSPEPFSVYKPSFFKNAYPLERYMQIPELGWIKKILEAPNHVAVNTAIFASRDLHCVQEYCDLALSVALNHRNREFLNNMGWVAALFLEQYLLSAYIQHSGSTCDFLFGYDEKTIWPKVRGYTHLLGPSKYNPVYQEKVKKRLYKDFPNLAVLLTPRVGRVRPNFVRYKTEGRPVTFSGVV